MENYRCRAGSIQGEGKASPTFLHIYLFLPPRCLKRLVRKSETADMALKTRHVQTCIWYLQIGFILSTLQRCVMIALLSSLRPWHVYTVFSKLMRSSAHIKARQVKTTPEPEATQLLHWAWANWVCWGLVNGSTVLELDSLKECSSKNSPLWAI